MIPSLFNEKKEKTKFPPPIYQIKVSRGTSSFRFRFLNLETATEPKRKSSLTGSDSSRKNIFFLCIFILGSPLKVIMCVTTVCTRDAICRDTYGEKSSAIPGASASNVREKQIKNGV